MLINSTKLTLANTMMIGVIMTVCSNNWISMWMGLEVSILSFIPFLLNKNMTSSESMMKYFIIQSVASTMFLFSVIYMLIGVNYMNEMMLTISMLIKLGSAPFHNWVLMIIESTSYFSLTTLLTMLKIPPLSIMHHINTFTLVLPILMSMIISSISAINQSSVRKVLAYSSIYNVSMVMISINKMNIVINFMIIYSTMMILFVMLVKSMKINFINQMISNEFSVWLKINLWINMLSMSGFPPLIGFITKLMVMQMLVILNEMIIMTFFVLTSLMVTMFYIRMAFMSMFNLSSFKKWTVKITKPMSFIMMMNLSLSPLMLTFTSVL